MDLSKLPRLSDSTDATPKATDSIPPDPPTRVFNPVPVEPLAYSPDPQKKDLLDAWVAIGVGTILLLMYPRFLQWMSSQLFHTHFDPFFDPAGAEVPYPKVPEFWGDLGPTLFGVVMIVEGLALLASRRKPVIAFAFALTISATLFNLIYLITSFATYGLAIVSALAVVFGVYIAIHQWHQLQHLRPNDSSVPTVSG